MKAKELLNEARQKLNIRTDYQLAKELEIPKERISDYLTGRRKPDEYACTRIAIALGIDPAKVIAEVAVEWEKNEKKREFWVNFLSRAASMNAITVGLIFSVLWCHAPEIHAMTMTSNAENGKTSYISVHYAKYTAFGRRSFGYCYFRTLCNNSAISVLP